MGQRIIDEIEKLVGRRVNTSLTFAELNFDFVDYAYLQYILARTYQITHFVDFKPMTVGELLDTLPLESSPMVPQF